MLSHGTSVTRETASVTQVKQFVVSVLFVVKLISRGYTRAQCYLPSSMREENSMVRIATVVLLAAAFGLGGCVQRDSTTGTAVSSMSSQPAATDRVAPARAAELINQGSLVLDVRTPEEFSGGHLAQAHNITHTEVYSRFPDLEADKNREIVVYCKSGRRAGIAIEQLRQLGYSNVHNAGGFEELKSSGLFDLR